MNNFKSTLIIFILVSISTILLGENGPKPVPFDFSKSDHRYRKINNDVL